jgi:hypothetical protein
MFRLNFTSKVMGPEGTERLRGRRVTQTLRSPSSNIVGELIHRHLQVGDPFEVALDGNLIGEAKLLPCDRISGYWLSIKDANRGGFESLEELEKALKRAGYRFKPLEKYNFYRIPFEWVG